MALAQILTLRGQILAPAVNYFLAKILIPPKRLNLAMAALTSSSVAAMKQIGKSVKFKLAEMTAKSEWRNLFFP